MPKRCKFFLNAILNARCKIKNYSKKETKVRKKTRERIKRKQKKKPELKKKKSHLEFVKRN